MRGNQTINQSPGQSPDRALLLLHNFLPKLYLPLLVLFLAVATWRPLNGAEDFWAHAAVGRWIWTNQTAPQQTLWLWSTSPVDWIAHSWLSQLAFYGLMQAGGVHLVLLATILLAGMPFLWFWRVWARRSSAGAGTALFFGLAILCAQARFQPRPELFTYFFLGVLLLFLIEFPRSLSLGNGLAMIFMFAVWANFHGGVALGLLILFVTAACEWVQRIVAKRKVDRSAWQLCLLSLLCAGAVNLNPYGLAYWKALAPVGGAMFEMIDEWKPPTAAPALSPEAIILVLLVAAVAAWGWSRNPERRWAQLFWLLLGCTLFLMARRNLWPCLLVAVAVAAANSNFLCGLKKPVVISWRAGLLARSATVIALITIAFVAVSPQALAPQAGGPWLAATSRFLPQGAASAVLKGNLPPPVVNDYLRSGYFHWRFAGRPLLYIDLLNAYPDALLAEYFQVVKRTPAGRQEWDRLRANTVVFGRYQSTDRLAPLAQYLDDSPLWRKAYAADDGAVWVRRSAEEE